MRPMTNPAIRLRGQDIHIVNYDGSGEIVKGTVALLETSTGEATQAYSDSGPIAWLDLNGDGDQIEFLGYTDTTGQFLSRRRIKAERIGTLFPVVKVHMSVEARVMAQAAQFSGQDFDGRDFST